MSAENKKLQLRNTKTTSEQARGFAIGSIVRVNTDSADSILTWKVIAKDDASGFYVVNPIGGDASQLQAFRKELLVASDDVVIPAKRWSMLKGRKKAVSEQDISAAIMRAQADEIVDSTELPKTAERPIVKLEPTVADPVKTTPERRMPLLSQIMQEVEANKAPRPVVEKIAVSAQNAKLYHRTPEEKPREVKTEFYEPLSGVGERVRANIRIDEIINDILGRIADETKAARDLTFVTDPVVFQQSAKRIESDLFEIGSELAVLDQQRIKVLKEEVDVAREILSKQQLPVARETFRPFTHDVLGPLNALERYIQKAYGDTFNASEGFKRLSEGADAGRIDSDALTRVVESLEVHAPASSEGNLRDVKEALEKSITVLSV